MLSQLLWNLIGGIGGRQDGKYGGNLINNIQLRLDELLNRRVTQVTNRKSLIYEMALSFFSISLIKCLFACAQSAKPQPTKVAIIYLFI